jgi:hypothetical protein
VANYQFSMQISNSPHTGDPEEADRRFDEAEEALEKAVKLDPNLSVAKTNLKALNSGPSGRGSVGKPH